MLANTMTVTFGSAIACRASFQRLFFTPMAKSHCAFRPLKDLFMVASSSLSGITLVSRTLNSKAAVLGGKRCLNWMRMVAPRNPQ
jgi:hypothetical protein